MTRYLAVLFAMSATGCAVAWDDCDHTVPRNLDLDAAGVATLEVMARAGSLDIRGEDGLQQIVVRGTACAGSAETLAQIRLVERRNGDRLIVAAELPETSGGWGFSDYSRLDLELRVPSHLALKVSDSSGDAEISGVASLDVDDSSGELRVSNIAGDLRVDDSSGDIDIRQIGGNLLVSSDSSGDIDIDDVVGDVLIEDDSSGDIDIRRVRGDAVVEDDSSGDIRFTAIGGGARVGDDSSGSIEANDIGRDFVVERDGSGSIHHANVRGSVRIPED